MQTILDLNAVDNPQQVADILRKAGDEYRESFFRLQADWQDESAGKVWDEMAKALYKAADRYRMPARWLAQAETIKG